MLKLHFGKDFEVFYVQLKEMRTLMTSREKEGRLEYIEVVRRQGNELHVLGRGEEMNSSDSTSYMAYHIIHDASTGKVVSEDSFLHRGNFPLFMCGCYMLSCEGDCPPILDHELSLEIHEYRMKADKYDNSIRIFKEANLIDLNRYRKDRRPNL